MPRDWSSHFSENIRHFEGYSIGKLFRLLGDPEVISLAGGLPSPDVFPVEKMRAVSDRRLRDNADAILQYSVIGGEADLIEAVCAFLAVDGVAVSPREVMITSSGQQGLDLVGRLFLDPGDAVVLDRPTFAGAIVAFQMQRPVFIGADIEDDGSDVGRMETAIRKFRGNGRNPKFIYVVPDFQNPSGITMSLEKRKALLELGRRYEIPIVEDSPYRNLRYVGRTLPTLFELDRTQGGENVIGIYTFSKLFCPGMRVGFNIGPKAVIEKMINIKEGSTLNTPKYNQDLCTAFLTEMDWQQHLAFSRRHYREKRGLFFRAMEDHFPVAEGITWTRPEGGLFSWVSLPEEIDTTALFHPAVTRYKVAFVPGSAFYGENPATRHMRVNFSYPPADRLAEAVRRLADCVKSCLHRM
ncbi:MAG TPA: PLP-dependent aminotransferase family protein [Desulfobacterales bacterium]